MSTAGISPPPLLPEAAPIPEKTLRRLFLALFLRGRGIRGLNKKQGAPKTIGEKLALTLLFYFLFGCMALFFLRQPIFALAVYLHAMTFVFLGMFIASSAGEILFNKEEADILLHRPINPKTMLWAKIRVLVEVSLWLAGAFNLVGLFVGFGSSGNWRFPLAHLFSTALEALFCTSCVVLVYQLCLRWFGRERLESLMTIAQVIVSIAAVMSGQILPQLVMRMNHVLNVGEISWWVNLLPPAWFAGFDDAFAGSARLGSWLLAALAVGVTGVVLWIAFGKLARNYEMGLQSLSETVSTRLKKQSSRRWLDRLVKVPPLSWWLRDPVARASFLLTAAYLIRDRDVKLRVYPGIAPILIIPFIFLFQNHYSTNSNDPGFGIPFSGIYLGMVPLLGLQFLQYSQQWQAADIFRAAPLPGPAALCHGARRAVLCLLTLPMLLLVGLIIWLLHGSFSQLALFLPGMIALPVFALVPNFSGQGVPLSLPADMAKSTRRGLNMILVMFVAFALAGLASFSWSQGWFWRLIIGEIIVAAGLYALMRLKLARTRWPPME
jgi:ABC-2 type transport system permease protein